MARPRDFDDILAKLPNAKKSGDVWIASCPLPGHKTPAGHLTLKDAGDKALVTCQGGKHRYHDYCRVWGFDSLTYACNETKIIDTYDYTDAKGKLLYQVIRYEPKDFKQRRRDGTGEWVWNLKGIKPVLYRLPEVVKAVREAQKVYICEGEKDCDNLAKIGLPATTNSGGAGKWRTEYGEDLAGASVVIIPDKDIPGQKHASKVASSLYDKARSIKILELPDRDSHQVKDVSDWLAAGGTLSELESLIIETPEYKPKESDVKLVCIAEVEPETVEWLWFPYIPKGKLTLLEGDPGIGKSWLGLAIATGVSLGEALPGTEVIEPASVLLASAEDGLGDTIRPRLDMMGADITKIHAIRGALDFGNGGLAVLERYIKQVCPALVIIDPLVAYIGARVDMHRANETRAVMTKLADIAERYGSATLAIRHLTKGGTLNPIYRGLGSIDLAAACRSILMAGCDPDDDNKRGIVHIKSNLAPKGTAIGYELRGNGFFWTGESDLTWQKILSAQDSGESRSALEEATEFLRDELAEGPVEAKQVLKDSRNLGIAERTLNRAKSELRIVTRREGEIGKRGGGRFTWELPGYFDSQKDLHCQDCHIEEFGKLNQNSYKKGPLLKTLGNLNSREDRSISCNKAEGFCSLRTGQETFSCIYQPDECPFLKGV